MPNFINLRMRAEFEKEFSGLDNFFFVDYRGMNSTETVTVRNGLRSESVQFRVIKNSLVEHALGERAVESVRTCLKGPTAICYSLDSDPVSVAKSLTGWAKKVDAMEVKGGVLGEQALSADEVVRLSRVPSREELLSMLVSGIQAPLSGLANCLQGPLTGMARILAAVRDQKEA
ncbi:MAG: 50S ribosomal protein L10 [Planctomycetota bacterium]|jgi:large subunit ribosomal protein L10|nr:50S ribosomal protein L10 [Planctomycetota bacterium]